jgi:ketosteroid isomerase-like protein
MSENLDLVRSILAAWERGDFSSTAWAHPDLECVIADGPMTGSWAGLAGLAEVTREVLGPMEAARIEAEEFRVLDGERVLALTRQRGRGKSSGLVLSEFAPEGAMLFHVRGGKVVRLTAFWDRDRALADLGVAG